MRVIGLFSEVEASMISSCHPCQPFTSLQNQPGGYQGCVCCAGLLTTEAGTLGRFSGNIVMSVVARLTGVDSRQELLRFGLTLYGIFSALLLLIGFYMLAVWRKLAT